MRVATLADADANDGGEPLRGSFLMGLVTPQFVPAAHHCGDCTVVIASGDVEWVIGGILKTNAHKCHANIGDTLVAQR